MVVVDIELQPHYNRLKRRETFIYKKANWEEIRSAISTQGQDIIESNESVEGKWLKLNRALTYWRFAVLNSHFWCWDSYFLKEAIFFCIVGLPLFGKEGSGTPVFKILVRALTQKL